jgi:hypothetical protein
MHEHIDNLTLSNLDRVVTIGSDRMMNAVKVYFNDIASALKNGCKLIASVNSPMQCMMKGVCGQCVQLHKCAEGDDFVYSCEEQDQDLYKIDFDFLNARLKQNSVTEQINSLWCGNCISEASSSYPKLQ